jgi:alpha-galactosidase
MAEPRRAIHAYLSDDALDGWRDFAEKESVSVSAIIEVLPELLLNYSGKTLAHDDPAINYNLCKQALLDELVENGRKVDAQRRKRGNR